MQYNEGNQVNFPKIGTVRGAILSEGKNVDDNQPFSLIGGDGEINKILPETTPVTGFVPDGGRPSLRKPVLAIIAIAVMLGVFVPTAVWLNNQNDKVDIASVERPIVTPSATASASPEPTQAPSSQAPEAPVTVEPPTEKPVETTVPSSKPSKPAPAECEVDALYPHYAGDKYLGKEAVKVLIEQNMAWNEVYSGEFHFPSQQDQLQNMDELYRNMDSHGPQRAGLDFFMLYNYNADTITERLKTVNGPCEELANLDHDWIEGIPSLFDDPEAASSHLNHSDFLVKLNNYANEWLNDRNTVLTGQAS